MRLWSLVWCLTGCGGDEAEKPQATRDGGIKAMDEVAAPKDICDAICARSQAAQCANDTSDCASECTRYVSQTPARCETQLDAFTACASSASFTCDADGESVAKSCDAQLAAWTACVQPTDAGGKLDASPPYAGDAGARDAAVCPLSDTEDTCGVCIKFSCCEEIAACGPACQELVKCANACPSTSSTDACAQSCYEKHPDGMAAFTAFAGCVGVQCEEACAAEP